MNKKNQPKPSEVIKNFLDYLVNSQKEYQAACTEMFAEDKKVQDFLHAIEFEKDSKVRSKISTKFHISRNFRRAAKDRSLQLERVAKFYSDKANKPFIDKLRSMVQDQKKEEEWLESERVYYPRGGDPDC
ncbi:hypothetical protein [Lacrimispora celerecrescens]|uniref:Uncharacterized protein n=1 Tax=[Clostridium] celerecrescens 18A TaxID=1286362 RepID=A0A2M8Z2U9_9FIRM|nr:hypothetical protein [Lacrimispora celerecrescens]PJJ27762.1 hypothetical protein H171_1238 [[Clostridium] celerecrescens 18A]